MASAVEQAQALGAQQWGLNLQVGRLEGAAVGFAQCTAKLVCQQVHLHRQHHQALICCLCSAIAARPRGEGGQTERSVVKIDLLEGSGYVLGKTQLMGGEKEG